MYLEIRHCQLILCISAQLHQLGHFRNCTAVSDAPDGVEHLPVKPRQDFFYRQFHIIDAFGYKPRVGVLCKSVGLDLPFGFFDRLMVKFPDLLLLRVLLGLEALSVHHAFFSQYRRSRCIGTIEYMIVQRCKLHSGMDCGCRGSSDQQRNGHSGFRHSLAELLHLV